jgi:hypothetical protein
MADPKTLSRFSAVQNDEGAATLTHAGSGRLLRITGALIVESSYVQDVCCAFAVLHFLRPPCSLSNARGGPGVR